MFDVDVRRLYSDIILDPHSLKDLRLLVVTARQEFLNAVLQFRTLQLAAQDAWSKAKIWHFWKIRKIERALEAVRATINVKRVFLDDMERALEIGLINDYDEKEKREFFIGALEEAESGDDMRYEKRLDELEKRVEKESDNVLLAGIRKQLAEVYFAIEKMDRQAKRRSDWQMHGPPSSVRKEFEKIHAELTSR
jgi:tetratricopeptide (TPR) repeat protein